MWVTRVEIGFCACNPQLLLEMEQSVQNHVCSTERMNSAVSCDNV